LACAAALWGQAPTQEQTGLAMQKTRDLALAYTKSLPDFVCTQLVHRYLDPTHRSLWRNLDLLNIRLSYFEQREDHKLVLVNGTPSDKSYDDLVGAVTVGEFGGIMQQIFDPGSQAIFTWEKWNKLNKRPTAIYIFHVDEPHSHYGLNFKLPSGTKKIFVGFRGSVEVDRETGDVLRISYAADGIPKTYPIHLATTNVTYAFAEVAGKKYLLPATSEVEMRSIDMWARNVCQFKEYRKFSTDSNISFGDGK
jgi:hypothetical protein